MKSNLVFVLTLLICGCASNVTTPSFSVTTSDVPSINSQTTSVLTSSIDTTTSVNNTSNVQYQTIKDIKNKAKDFKGLENNVGVYESNIEVSLNLKLLACLDAITTKAGYGNRYKILMTDGSDYIYLKVGEENYKYLKDYVKDQSVYFIKGNISLYNGEVELTVEDKPIYLKDENINVDYDLIAEQTDLMNVYKELNNLKLNTKGIAFSKLVKVNVKCLAKDINNTNLYFGNGEYIINVHGHDKVTNSFQKDTSYTLIGAITMHNFRPGLEYVSHYNCDDVEFNISDLKTMKASDFYNYKYEVDKYETYPNYTKLFEKPYVIEGYINSYVKDNKEYLVIDDVYKENYYSSYTAALNAKSVFLVNENYVGITDSNVKYCSLYEHLINGDKLKITVFPYLWNTQKYFQVYSYSFEIID